MAIDPLDIAYIAIGARQALDTAGNEDAGIYAFEGELDFVQACISQVERLDRHWHALADGFPGVWCYEVAEPFGHVYGRHLLAGGSPEDAERLLQEIVNGCLQSHA